MIAIAALFMGQAAGARTLASLPTSAVVGCKGDGYTGAPAGAPQHPALLASYRVRPACHVAGVDYHVGAPDGMLLKDPLKVRWSPPFVYDAPHHAVRCTGPGGGVIDGFDFSLHGGISITNVSCDGLVVKNSRFVVGANCVSPLNEYVTAPNVTFEYNTFDGGSAATGCSGDAVGEGVNLAGGGRIVVKYNWMKNVQQHFVSFGGGSEHSGVIDYEYNLEERCGYFQGAHCNGFQIVGGDWKGTVVAFNTYISGQPDTALTSDGETHPVGRFAKGSNKVTEVAGVVTSGIQANSLRAGMSVTSPCLPQAGKLIEPAQPSTATPDLTLSVSATRSGVCTFDVPNAYPSGIVGPIRYAAQLGSSLRDGLIANNTIINTGPIVVTSFSIYCVAEPKHVPANLISNTTIRDNFIDESASFGTFYGGPGYCQAADTVVSGNRSLKSGRTIPQVR